MTRDDLERRIWEVAGRQLTGAQVDEIVDAAEAYAVVRREDKPAVQDDDWVLRHQHPTALYPVIAALAEALMPDVPHVAARGAARGSAA